MHSAVIRSKMYASMDQLRDLSRRIGRVQKRAGGSKEAYPLITVSELQRELRRMAGDFEGLADGIAGGAEDIVGDDE